MATGVESSTQSILMPLQIFHHKEDVEKAVRGFLKSAYHLGIISVNDDESLKFNPEITEDGHQREASPVLRCSKRLKK